MVNHEMMLLGICRGVFVFLLLGFQYNPSAQRLYTIYNEGCQKINDAFDFSGSFL